MKNIDNYPTLAFETQQDWEMWLEKHQSEAKGVWLKLAKKAKGDDCGTLSCMKKDYLGPFQADLSHLSRL